MRTVAGLTMNLPDRKLRAMLTVSRATHNLGGTSTALYLAGGATGELPGRLLERESIPTHPVPIAEPARQVAGAERLFEEMQRALRMAAAAP